LISTATACVRPCASL